LTTIEFTNDFAVISKEDATEVKVGVVAKTNMVKKFLLLHQIFLLLKEQDLGHQMY